MNLESIRDAYPDKYAYNYNYYAQSINSWSDYLALFEAVKNEKIIGESSSGYINGAFASSNIKEHLPNAKMLLILRDPVDRLISRWSHIRQETEHPIGKMPLESVFTESVWLERKDLVSMGYYYTNIQRFLDKFSKDQLMIVFFEELKSPAELMKKIFRFLDVDENYIPGTLKAFNISGEAKSRTLDQIIGKKSPVFKFLRNNFPILYTRILKNTLFEKLLYALRKRNLEKVNVPYELRKKIYSTFYAEEIHKLEKLIDRDLSHWKYS